MHGGSSAGRPKPKAPAKASPAPPVHDQEMIAAMRSSGLGAQTALGVMILSGVLERFPKLKVSLIETSTGWLPQFLNQLDAVVHAAPLAGRAEAQPAAERVRQAGAY